MRSSEPSRLDHLSRGNQRDAALNEAFVVLSIGASLIATLGLLANSADVVIGAMVVAPWIKPLRAGAFAVIVGNLPLLVQALRTLLLGVGTTLVLAALLGTVAGLPQFGSEVMARTSPNLLNLGIALVAGALASYANLSRDAVSSLAGTAIAVALVPPVCVMGLLLAHQHLALATGAGLLFATNLLGVLTGGVVLMAWKDPLLRQQLRRSHLSVANFALTALLLIPLGTSFLGLLRNARRESTRETVQLTIETFLKRQTVTFGEGKEVELEKLEIDWDPNPPVIRALVRVTDPTLPTFKQVSAVQDEINRRQSYRFQLVVQRTAVDVVGPEEAPNPSTVAEDSVLQSIPPSFSPLLSPPPLPALPPEQQQDN
jgi:uncharacterized hydrophobic protein (TIGR00271 family)